MADTQIKVMLIGPSRGGGQAITGQIAQTLEMMPGILPRGLPSSKLLEYYRNLFSSITDPDHRKRLVGQHLDMAALSECITFKPQLIIVMSLSPIWPLFLQGARRMGATVVHWLIENFRYGPADESVPQLSDIARHYDAIFTIQKDDCHQALRSLGARNQFYLPTAAPVDPRQSASATATQPKQYEVSFVGYPYPNRVKLFPQLSNYGLKLFGPGWSQVPGLPPEMQGADRWIESQEEAQIIASSKIGLNIHSTMEVGALIPANDFINPRVFQIPAQGTFQLVNDCELLGELFEKGQEVAVYHDLASLKQQLEYYLADEPAREALARRGYERVLRDHTYEKRLGQMLKILGF